MVWADTDIAGVPIGVVIGLCSALLTAVVTEVYCHRCLAHRAFGVHTRLASFFDTYFRVIVMTDPETWAAVHRVHHRYADTPLDPHSPVQRRPLTVLAGSSYLFLQAKQRVQPGTPSRRRVPVIRGLLFVFYGVVFGPVQLLIMVVVHLVFYLGVMGMVNAVGHLYGRQTHPDVPGYDLAWLAIPLLGHGYHNSHHAHPAAARTGPLDPIWPLLRVLGWMRLVELDERHPRTSSSACCGAAASLVAGR